MDGLSEGENTDLQVARDVARFLNIEHDQFCIPSKPADPSCFFTRFVAIGECRIDNIAAYMDDFAMWEKWSSQQFTIMLRGDETFGRPSVKYEKDVWALMDTWPLDHYGNTRILSDFYDVSKVPVPSSTARKDSESLASWRDRIDITFNRPLKVSSLNDLKTGFIEVVSPFLFPSVVNYCCSMADELRNDKHAIRSLLGETLPEIDYASQDSLASRKEICMTPKMAEFLINDLQRSAQIKFFGTKFIDYLTENLILQAENNPFLEGESPDASETKRIFKNRKKEPKVSFFFLALRSALAVRANSMFIEDALIR